MTLEDWGRRWNVPPQALEELFRTFIVATGDPDDSSLENVVQSEVRLEAAAADVYLFRNNVGAGKMESGNFVRFGLANDSSPMNKRIKSGDLVGLRKRLIVPADVGTYIGQFVSRECKKRNWKFRGTVEENAQMTWAALINAQGGDAKIVTGPGSFS